MLIIHGAKPARDALDPIVEIDQDFVQGQQTRQHHPAGIQRFRVINLSVGLPASDTAGAAALQQATADAWAAGVVVVDAAGNSGPRAALDAPAAGRAGIAVGAAGADGRPAAFTSLGTRARRVAPFVR